MLMGHRNAYAATATAGAADIVDGLKSEDKIHQQQQQQQRVHTKKSTRNVCSTCNRLGIVVFTAFSIRYVIL